MNKITKLLKKIIFIAISIYAIVTFCNQQKILNTYASNNETLNQQLFDANEYQEELTQIKENSDSEEYIEELAREKLDMYLPNERVYINNEN